MQLTANQQYVLAVSQRVHSPLSAYALLEQLRKTGFYVQVQVYRVLGRGLIDFEEASRALGWLQQLRGTHTPETEEYGIRNFAYRARGPFQPQLFFYLLESEWLGIAWRDIAGQRCLPSAGHKTEGQRPSFALSGTTMWVMPGRSGY